MFWTSKWNNKAYMSRINNNIDHDIIKPTVIIQDYIDLIINLPFIQRL